MKAFVINLERRKDRLQYINENYNLIAAGSNFIGYDLLFPGLGEITLTIVNNVVTSSSVVGIQTAPCIIPNTVTSIGANAFSPLGANLTAITIPSSVTSINSTAFTNCQNVSLVISNNGNKIADEFLKNITQISSIQISLGIQILGTNAFSGCSGIKSFSFS